MTNLFVELISPERGLFSGEARAVMLPGTEGDMTVMPGHEPIVTTLQPGLVVVTDVQGHSYRRFVRGGFATITGARVTVLAERPLALDELTRERLDEEIVRLESIREAARDDDARRVAEFALRRLQQVQTALTV
jgi:F-type H+-transporting ATPase subunit epsilon